MLAPIASGDASSYKSLKPTKLENALKLFNVMANLAGQAAQLKGMSNTPQKYGTEYLATNFNPYGSTGFNLTSPSTNNFRLSR